jgi:chemotaxis protein methyltransferase CheR
MILERVNISDEQLKRLADVVHAHCGIHLHTGKKELVQARLARRLRVLGDMTVDAYLGKLLNNPDDPEFDHLIDALSTNLTSFFRENAHFEYLGKTYLPELIARRGASVSRKLRGWSAACSTGEEPYTMGITAFESLGSAKSNWDVKILATDISRPVLAQAKKGVYASDRVEKIPSQYRGTYFEPVRGSKNGELQVGSALRGAVKFANLNLMEPWPFDGPFDFVFCRNVMIYFDKQTQERLVNRIHDVLAPGGVFFTGHSESLTGVNHKFQYVLPTIYRKRG